MTGMRERDEVFSGSPFCHGNRVEPYPSAEKRGNAPRLHCLNIVNVRDSQTNNPALRRGSVFG